MHSAQSLDIFVFCDVLSPWPDCGRRVCLWSGCVSAFDLSLRVKGCPASSSSQSNGIMLQFASILLDLYNIQDKHLIQLKNLVCSD